MAPLLARLAFIGDVRILLQHRTAHVPASTSMVDSGTPASAILVRGRSSNRPSTFATFLNISPCSLDDCNRPRRFDGLHTIG
jgi:hypothetical protein